MNKLASTISALACAVALSTGAQAANLVQNGDFEAKVELRTTVPGFTVAPGSDIYVENGYAYAGCCLTGGTPEQLENQFATFGANNADNISTLRQVLTLTVDQAYSFTFDYGALGAAGLSQTITAKVTDEATGAVLDSFTQSDDVSSDFATAFNSVSRSFIARGATRISFSASPTVATDVDLVLDNVTVTAMVPEPATWAMMILGFGAVGASMRRTRRHRSGTIVAA